MPNWLPSIWRGLERTTLMAKNEKDGNSRPIMQGGTEMIGMAPENAQICNSLGSPRTTCSPRLEVDCVNCPLLFNRQAPRRAQQRF